MREIIRITYLLTFGVILGCCSLQAQQSQNVRRYFQLPDAVTADDYLENHLIFKIRPEYRGYCSPNAITLPHFDFILNHLEPVVLEKAIPHAQPPSEPVNAIGQKMVDLSLIYTLEYSGALNIEDAVNLMLRHPAVEYAEPWYVHRLMYDPDDPDTTSQYYIDQIDARPAWDISKGDSNVVIGIIDTGTEFNHPDLDGKHYMNLNDTVDGVDNDGDGYVDNISGWDFGGDFFGAVGGDNDPTFVGSGASNDHGVIVAGPAGAATDNGYCISAIGFNSKLLPVRVAVSNGLAIVFGYQGLIYAADHNADIINLSWGSPGRSRFGQDAVRYATINKEKMVVAAAGNTPDELDFYPASYPEVISVAGTEQGDLFWFNNATFGATYSYLVDVCAPARAIRTIKSTSGCGNFSGSSLAAPIVAGVAGLVKADNPQMSMGQVAQRVRVSSDTSIYALNTATYTEKMGRGQVNALSALTQNSPSVRIADIWLDDGDDGLYRPGDTVDVRCRFVNWLDPVQNLNITLSSASGFTFEILHSTINVGTLGTMDTVSNWYAPFKIVIRSFATPGQRAYLRFSYSGDNYNDKEFYRVDLEPDYVNVDENDFAFSIDGTGEFGYVSWDNNPRGIGTAFRNFGISIRESGFLLGTGSSDLADNMTNVLGNQNNHFVENSSPYREVPGQIAGLEAFSSFSTGGTGSPTLNTQVDQHIYQFVSEEDKEYTILEYTFTNTSTLDTLKDAYTALYMDWELGWDLQNAGTWDPARRLIWATDPNDHFNPYLFGVSLLTHDSLRATVNPLTGFTFSNADKWRAITNQPDSANSVMDDVHAFVGTGPFTIAPGGTHTIAYAFSGGVDTTEMFTASENAYQKYWCVIRGGMSPLPDLGEDIHHCTGDTTYTLNPGSFSSYLWSDGSTGPSLAVDSSGTYSVTVTDGAGCSHHSYVDVIIDEGVNGSFSYAPSTILVGDTVSFSDLTPGAKEWGWDFGDGSMVCPISSQTTHVYSTPGTYTVQMIVGNHICADTVTQVIQVDTLVSDTDPLTIGEKIIAFPNPTQGELTIRFNGPYHGLVEFALLDLMGRKLTENTFLKDDDLLETRIDMGTEQAGIYLLECKMGDLKAVIKVQLIR